MKKFNLFKVLILVSCITFFAIACKKELTTENKNPIENAKSWYIDHKANSKTAFIASNDITENIATQIDWENTKVYNFSDGKEVIATPVNMAKPNNKTVPGSFMLLIYQTNGEYQSQMIYNQKDNYFSENASKSDIEASFMVVQKNNELRSLAKSKKTLLNPSNGKVMNMPIDETLCIDWYLIETITWPDGYVSVEETYLYTTCPPSGGGGGGGTNPEEFIPDFGQATDILESSNIQFENDTARLKKDVWIFLNAETFDFKSRELIYQVKTSYSGGWVFGAITHDSHYVVGDVYYGDVSIEGFKWEKTQSLQSVSASVEFRTKIVFDTPFGVGTKYGDMEFSIHNWNSW